VARAWTPEQAICPPCQWSRIPSDTAAGWSGPRWLRSHPWRVGFLWSGSSRSYPPARGSHGCCWWASAVCGRYSWPSRCCWNDEGSDRIFHRGAGEIGVSSANAPSWSEDCSPRRRSPHPPWPWTRTRAAGSGRRCGRRGRRRWCGRQPTSRIASMPDAGRGIISDPFLDWHFLDTRPVIESGTRTNRPLLWKQQCVLAADFSAEGKEILARTF